VGRGRRKERAVSLPPGEIDHSFFIDGGDVRKDVFFAELTCPVCGR